MKEKPQEELYRNLERRESLSSETLILQQRPLNASDSAGLGRVMMDGNLETPVPFLDSRTKIQKSGV